MVQIQAIPVPVLANYEEDAARVRRLAEENESLRLRLATLQQRSSLISEAQPSADLMDDFYIIAQYVFNPKIVFEKSTMAGQF